MFGVGLILILAIMGGAIAFLGDKLGSKIGKKKLSIFGLRPHYTSILMTIITGIAVAAVTMGSLTLASNDVRTALFGMTKLRNELESLNNDKKTILAELDNQNAKVKELDEKIAASQKELEEANKQKDAVEAQLADAQAKYAQAQNQVAELESSRNKLQSEVGELETATKKLREGLVAVREGDIIFRSGEIIYAGVLRAGLDEGDNKAQMDAFLAQANERVLDRLNAKDDTQALWVSRDMVDEALAALAKGSGNVYVRVCAAGNIISGEMAVSRLEMVANNRVYEDGQTIISENITVDIKTDQVEAALMAFLREINKKAVSDGVIPDPISGKVGAIDAAEMEELSEKVRSLGGRVNLRARARGDIAVSGPVLLKVDVRANE